MSERGRRRDTLRPVRNMWDDWRRIKEVADSQPSPPEDLGKKISRRDALKLLAATGAGAYLGLPKKVSAAPEWESEAGGETRESTLSPEAQQLVNEIWARVPPAIESEHGPLELIDLETRWNWASLNEQQRLNAMHGPYINAEMPGNSDPHYGFEGMYDRFNTERDVNKMIELGLPPEQIVQVLESRKQAIELYCRRFYGDMLEGTLFGKQRVEITQFAKQIEQSHAVNQRLNQRGVNYDVLHQNPKVAAARVLHQAGYIVDVLIDENVSGSRVPGNLGNAHFESYQALTPEGVEVQANEILRTLHHIGGGDVSRTRIFYLNEIDLANYHWQTANGIAPGNIDPHRYDVMTTAEYANSYYMLAEKLAQHGVIVMPSTLGMSWGLEIRDIITDGDGVNPFMRALVERRMHVTNPEALQDGFAINYYGTDTEIVARINAVRGQVQRLEGIYGVGNVPPLARMQEFYDLLGNRADREARGDIIGDPGQHIINTAIQARNMGLPDSGVFLLPKDAQDGQVDRYGQWTGPDYNGLDYDEAFIPEIKESLNQMTYQP